MTPDPILPGQESVWDFPRPAIAEQTAAHVVVELGGIVIADTRHAVRTLEAIAIRPSPWDESKLAAAAANVVGEAAWFADLTDNGSRV